MTVAKVDYYYNTSTDNLADFRYASQSVTLANVPGNTETIALTNQITERVCWSSTSSLYQTVSPCAGYISTSGSRSLSDGNGGQVNEYGYYGGLTASQSNKVLMLDVPYLYFKASTTYDFNGTTILSSGAYDSYSSQ
jgi:hypothetical protein